jgi:4-phytase/acid phosphatase
LIIATACVLPAANAFADAGAAHDSEPVAGERVLGPANWQLESVVILSRHGVRSPTASKPALATLSPDRWPDWPVSPGYLTDRGADLVGQLGQYYGAWLRAKGVLPAQSCPKPGELYAWADVDQRTRRTGDAVIQNIAPGCELSAVHQTILTQPDPIFHATESGACRLDPVQARAAIDARLGDAGIEGIDRRYAESLAKVGDVLHFNQSQYCREHGTEGACRFEALGNAIEVDDDGRHVKLHGPLGIASTVSEVFLLEYAQGLSENDVAWGRMRGAEDLRLLLQAHNAQFDLMAKTPYLASHAGTPLMQQIIGALEQRATGKSLTGIHAPANNSVYVLAGHDTNVANIAGMLGLRWTLPDQPDETPPGGALIFSLWRDPISSERYVSVELLYQSLAQLRQELPLSIAAPPQRLPLPIAGCVDSARTGACRLDDFMRIARKSLVSGCIHAGS